MITFSDFKNVELRVGTVLKVERLDGSEKLLKVQIDLGEEFPRQILAGLAKFYTPEELEGTQVIVVANLEPKQMMGTESQGMLLAAGEIPVLIRPEKFVKPGTQIF